MFNGTLRITANMIDYFEILTNLIDGYFDFVNGIYFAERSEKNLDVVNVRRNYFLGHGMRLNYILQDRFHKSGYKNFDLV